MDKKGGISRVSVENFLSDSTETHFVAEPYCAVFQRISISEKVYGKEGVGVSSFSVNVFLPDSAGKFRSGTLPCCVSENFQQQKCLQIGKRGKYQDFPSIFFSCHTVEKCRRGFLQSFNNFGDGESLEEKVRGRVSIISVESFLSHSAGMFQRATFRVSLISGIENFNAPEVCVTIFCREFFVSQYRIISQENPSVLSFRKFPAAIKFMHRRRGMAQGVSRLSVKIFLSHSAEKSSRGNLLCCVSENFGQHRNLWIRGGGSIKIFRRKFFFLTVPKKLVR